MSKGPLEILASDIIGDSKRPNIYFVSKKAKVVAIFLDQEEAIEYAINNGATAVEDRLTGVIWGD